MMKISYSFRDKDMKSRGKEWKDMKVYHGTNLASSIQILEAGVVRSHKLFSRQKQSYASFATEISEAHEYGRIIFAFEGVEQQLIPVMENDWNWVKKNVDIYRYISALYQTKEEIEREVKSQQDYVTYYYEMVSKGDFTFQPNQVTIYVCSMNKVQQKLVYGQLRKRFGQQYRILLGDDITQLLLEKETRNRKLTIPQAMNQYRNHKGYMIDAEAGKGVTAYGELLDLILSVKEEDVRLIG